MATTGLSIDAKRYSVLFTGQWSSWVSATGTNVVWAQNRAYVFHRVNLYKGNDVQSLTSVTISVPLVTSGGADNVGVRVAIFTSDVTGGSSFPSGGKAGPLETISYLSGTKTHTCTISLSGITSNTIYIGYYVDYSSGDVYVDTGGTSITETYTERVIPQISFGTVTADNSGLHIPIYNGNNYTLTCRITAGNTDYPGNNEELYSGTSSSGRFDVPIEVPNDVVDWFNTAANTDSFIIPITITVTGGNPSPITKGLRYVEDRAAAKESMRPTVSSITTLIQQPTGFPSDYASTYISGFSKCKVTAVITRPTDALVSTVTLSYPGGRTVTMTPVSGSTDTYEGTTFSALAKDTTFTVTVTDARGLSNTGTERVADVVPYVLPSVSIDPANTYRCNSQGVKTDGGDHYKIRVTPQISTIIIDSDTGNDTNYITELTVGLKNAPAVERHTIPSGTTSDTLPPVSAGDTGTLPQPKQAYVLTVIIQDRISGPITREYTLKGLQRDFVLNHRGGLTHLGIGTTPEETDQNSIELPKDGVFLLGGIPAQAFNIPYSDSTDGSSFNYDFLNVDYEERTAPTNASAYFFLSPEAMEDCENYPVMSYDGHDDLYKDVGWVGFRTVSILNEYTALVQVIEFQPFPGRIWINAHVRTTTGQVWSGWKYHPPTVIT